MNPKICTIFDVFGNPSPGFYWQGNPYKLPNISQEISQENFNKYWKRGWDDRFNSRPNTAHHLKEPFAAVYAAAYQFAPVNPAIQSKQLPAADALLKTAQAYEVIENTN